VNSKYKISRKKQGKRWIFNVSRKWEVESSETGEFNVGEEVT